MRTTGSVATTPAVRLLTRAFHAGVEAADPGLVLAGRLPPVPSGRLLLIAVGKAAEGMAAAALAHYRKAGIEPEGILIAPGLKEARDGGIRHLPGGHPQPDRDSQRAGAAVLELLAGAGQDDLVLCLISGGASALMVAPDGVSLEEYAALNRELLISGADINRINTVRRKLCRLKGGGLALAAAPARVVALVLSDVVGDDPAVIASGPTVADPDSPEDALAVLDAYSIGSSTIRNRLALLAGTQQPAPARSSTEVVGSSRLSLAAAQAELQAHGWPVRLLADDVTGDSAAAAEWHARAVKDLLSSGERCALLSGGETTVTVPAGGRGLGGPNSHFVLSLALQLWDEPRVTALAGDTDGIDGACAAAGGFVSRHLFAAADRAEAQDALERCDSGGFLQRHGHALVTGPTGTNVNDLRIMLVED